MIHGRLDIHFLISTNKLDHGVFIAIRRKKSYINIRKKIPKCGHWFTIPDSAWMTNGESSLLQARIKAEEKALSGVKVR